MTSELKSDTAGSAVGVPILMVAVANFGLVESNRPPGGIVMRLGIPLIASSLCMMALRRDDNPNSRTSLRHDRAEPRTELLRQSVAIDANGFILTGAQVGMASEPFATSVPGLFAVGAVGDGSIVVATIHSYLALAD